MSSDLSRRIWFTLAALVICRLGTYVPIPGIDPGVLAEFLRYQTGGMLTMMDAFAGGGFSYMSVFALGLIPYMTVGAIVLLVISVSPKLKIMLKESAAGRKKINQYIRYGTVILAATQAYGLAVGLESISAAKGLAVPDPGLSFRVTTVITLAGGTTFLVWLGEQITQRGVGRGALLIVSSGIAAELPSLLAGILELGRTGAVSAGLIFALPWMAVGVIAFILFMERAERRVLTTRIEGEHSYLPLKLNAAGVIPPLFAFSLFSTLTTTIGFSGIGGPDWPFQALAFLGHSRTLYLVIFGVLIALFTFLCAAQAFDPASTAANLKAAGKVILGIRPGELTERYLRKLQILLTLFAAAYLLAICVLLELLVPIYLWSLHLGGAALLIVVWVILDTIGQIRARLQPPAGGPPDDFSGAVGARAVFPTHTSAVGSTKRRRTRDRTVAKVD